MLYTAITKKVPNLIKFYEDHEHLIADTEHQQRAILISKIDASIYIDTLQSKGGFRASYFPKNMMGDSLYIDEREDFNGNIFLCIDFKDEVTIIGKVFPDLKEEMKKWTINANFLISVALVKKESKKLWERSHL